MSTVSLPDAIAAQAERRPEAPALAWRGEDVTYRDLFDQALREQARIDGLGLAGGEPVGVLAPKSPRAVALVLGCLLAGRRFLLPSPTLAERTLRDLFARAGCRHVLTPADQPATGLYATDLPAPPPFPPPAAGLEGVSFMLTTSGSTGTPKIVPLGRAAVDRFIAWTADRFDIRAGKTVLNYAPLNFDLCLLDVWTALAHGARVVLVDPDRATSGRHLLDLIAGHDVHVVQGVPLLYGLLADAAGDGPPLDAVQHVIVTGDAIAERTLAELPRLFPKARLYNVYGCTETNDSFVHEVNAAAAPNGPLPLGEPLPGVRALIVGDDGGIVTGPGAGELYVATPFQATGYLDAGRDAERFVPHPDRTGDAGRAGVPDDVRYFRTGDLVRREADGRLVLAGRRDFQVKVRGVAVNTAEVERALQRHPDVVEAAVVPVSDPLAGRRLLGLVQRAPGSQLNSLGLLQHCSGRLAPAAVPSALRILDEPLPKTTTGKLDRTAVERTYADRPARKER